MNTNEYQVDKLIVDLSNLHCLNVMKRMFNFQ